MIVHFWLVGKNFRLVKTIDHEQNLMHFLNMDLEMLRLVLIKNNEELFEKT
jgi:hypothetical protein